MSWRIAKSLLKLRKQINTAHPNRDKASDGGIGDENHANRDSDHNPWVKDARGQGVVTAIDIDEDLTPNTNTVMPMIEAIIASRDPRVKYIIYEGRMCSSYPARGVKAWTWRKYSGKNPHKHHAHISVNASAHHYDSEADWDLGIPSIRPVASPVTTSNTEKDLTPAPTGENRLEREQTPAIDMPAEGEPAIGNDLPSGAAPNASADDKQLSPQNIDKERPSLFTRVMTSIMGAIAAAIASVTSMCGGSEVAGTLANKSAERVAEAPGDALMKVAVVVIYIVVGLGAAVLLFWIAAKFYEKSAQRSNELNKEKLNAASSDKLNTVEFKK